ncbi:hypothetical protein BDQ12DRAFT_68645 [Crucibulum laeve]|uniref:Uncharacterized protein n=1 Tax=Crucibulum laeve TaxID=68775 RepID=A0A5C3LGL8_9AGAR|nr:hypothetical protein BDQ12DRAFT_68645 [Crucibulum laeve]
MRAKAQSEGTSFKSTVEASKKSQAEKFLKTVPTRRNPGRMDGVQWNGDSFVCASKVDDGVHTVTVEPDNEDDYTALYKTPQAFTVSLMDIAKPAKTKGIAKEFELVEGIKHVIALDDSEYGDDFSQWDDEEWEHVYDEYRKDTRQSYSAILRGHER